MKPKNATIAGLILWACLMMAPPALAEDPALNLSRLVQGNTAFALDLYAHLRQRTGNLFFSPYSISMALAMTYRGARGTTAQEMAKTLHLSLEPDRTHATFADLRAGLAQLDAPGNISLHIANSLWPQKGYPLLTDFTTDLARYYGVSVQPVDFLQATEQARQQINRWIEEATQSRITEMIPPGVLNSLTHLVLVNAIYFKASWAHPFTPESTQKAPFQVSPETSVTASMMRQTLSLHYGETESVQLLELPYRGHQMSMILLLPRQKDGLAQLEQNLSPSQIETWRRGMAQRSVDLFFPKFTFWDAFSLKDALSALGMVDAFSKTCADFSGMDGKPRWLSLAQVLHKSFVTVDEEGTEAAAATTVVMEGRHMGAKAVTFRADHPFLFLIQDNPTGSLLFMGRITDPTNSNQ